MKYVVESLADALMPRLCPVCGRSLVRGEKLMCTRCMMALPRTRSHLQRDNSIMARLSRPGLEPVLAAAWMEYSRHSPYAAIIRDAKYNSMPRLARDAGEMMAREMIADGMGEVLADIDVLLPVPMHWTKLLRRGYNQSRMVADGIAAATGIAVGDNLRSARRHSTQTRRSAEERRRNVAGTVRIADAGELRGLHVAVVDDVITTGATMADALRALTTEAEPRAVSVLALAAVHADEWGMRQ